MQKYIRFFADIESLGENLHQSQLHSDLRISSFLEFDGKPREKEVVPAFSS
jgi:hypothetical protein